MQLDATPALARRTLRWIQLVLLAGVLLFGAAVLLIHRSGERAPIDATASWPLRVAFLVLLVLDLPALLAIRLVQRRAGDFQRRATLAIVAWAVAEGLALLGAVIYLLTARATLYALGTVVLIATFFFVPAPATRNAGVDALDGSGGHG